MSYRDDGYSSRRGRQALEAALAIAAGAAIVGGIHAMARQTQTAPRGIPGDAPGYTSRKSMYGDYAVTGRTITINRPRSELYAYWRDFSNLPKFMESVEKVEWEGDVSVWTIQAPGGDVRIRAHITTEKQDEEIAWRSVQGSDIDTEGKVTFRDAPGGRGTEVEAIVAYIPPVGRLGALVAKLFQKEPRVQGRRELKRFKMLMETGEVTTSHNRQAA